ncbi:hypothetical protein DM01DRAFT_1411315 [Hesseltinella vesiculosa]|uniref:CigA protein n=1 Tax=Hesseltinella vesiculosa TaxID=101127 RepID=A0A1X2G5A8_9FUNG|nr:hypothetical protein DM01DRAFT_1411315 [Hesseltinella vesiculosa]
MPSRIVEKPEKHETTAGLSSKSNQVAVDFPDPFAFHTPSPEEKYITYLPHSGFHNQRIELENAFLLAAYLNRTLLIPDVYLGNPAMPWLRFDKMYERILLQTKNGLDHCPQIPQGGPYPMECLNYDRWTKLPWTFFYDFEPLAADVPIVLRSDLSLEWLQSTLGIAKKDIQLMKDISPYEFRVYDHPKSKTPLAKFMNRYDVETLAAIDAKVLHFGSVFGSHRVLAQRPQHALWAMKVRTHMIFDTPVLVDTARQVVDQLGGTANFIGLHIRVGDGLFKVRASINIDDIYHALVNQFTDLTLDQLELLDNRHDEDRKERTDYEVKTLRVVSDVITSAPLSVDHTKLRSPDALGIVPAYPLAQQLSCRGQASDAVDTSRFCKTVVYIATDAPSGKDNPLLKKIRDTFPCVFDLSDFPFVFDRLGQVQVSDENVKLESYLIPMLDAIISAHGHTFFGTKDSTFTTYIERQLHPVYTSKEVPRSGPAVIE